MQINERKQTKTKQTKTKTTNLRTINVSTRHYHNSRLRTLIIIGSSVAISFWSWRFSL